MKKTKFLKREIVFVFIPIIILFVLFLYNYAHAGGLVSGCNTGEIDALTGQYKNPCNFNNLITLINTVVRFLLFVIATPLISLILIYVGFLYLRSADSSELRTKAKKIFFNVIIGYVIALSAWLIVNTILNTLGFTGENYLDGTTEPSPENPTPTPPAPTPEDSGVLYIGGSYEEENPTGNTCTINLESLPIGPSAYVPYKHFGINTVFADENEIEKQQAKARAEEFRKARCWLTNWYKDRKITNPTIKTAYERNKQKIIDKLETSRFTVLTPSAFVNKFPGMDAVGISLSNEGVFIMNAPGPMFDTLLHELAHQSENNGALVPYEIRSYLDSNIFPRSYLEKFVTSYAEADSFSKSEVQTMFCYIIHGIATKSPCYSIKIPDPVISSKANTNMSVSADINGRLYPDRLYHYRLEVSGKDSKKTTGNEMTFKTSKTRTPDSTILKAITKAATNVTSDFATLNGLIRTSNIDDTAYFNIEGPSFKKEYKISSDLIETRVNTDFVASASVDGLTPNTTYSFWIRLKGIDGKETLGQKVTLKTNKTPTPSSTITKATTKSTTNLTWDSVTLNGIINTINNDTEVYFNVMDDDLYKAESGFNNNRFSIYNVSPNPTQFLNNEAEEERLNNFEFKTLISPVSYTEIDARLMMVRYAQNLTPDQPFSIDRTNNSYMVFIPFRIPFTSKTTGFIPPAFNSGSSDEIEVFKAVSLSIVSKYRCEYVDKNIEKEIICTENYITNPPSTPFSKSFGSVDEAKKWMSDIIYTKFEDLMNNTM